MSRISLSDQGASPWERLLGHTPTILQQWIALEEAFFSSGTFSPELREQVRRTLAWGNGCAYCMAKSGRPDEHQADPRISLAVGCAEIFAQNPQDMDESVFDLLKTEFSEAEISELFAFMSFLSASQRFGAALGLESRETYEHVNTNGGANLA